jgi:hypothetical protein
MTTGGRHDMGGRPGGEELLDLLYGELPPDEERAVRARVAGDPALSAELAELERVRQLVHALPEAEPPGRLSAQLLSQAAQLAPRGEPAAERAGGGLWARLRSWFEPVIAHPALSAAASLLLLAGVAGVLIARGGDDMADVHRNAPANEVPASASESAPEPALPPSPETGDPAVGGPADPAAGGAPGGSLEGGAAGSAAPQAEAPAQDESSGSAAPADGYRASERREVEKARRSPRRARVDDRADDKQSAGGDADRAKQAEGRKAMGLRQGESAPPAAAPAPGSSQPAEEEAESVEVAPEPPAPMDPSQQQTRGENKKDAASSARELHKQAVSAAAGRRCLEVQSLVENIRKQDLIYHDKIVQHDKRLSVCLTAGKQAK